MTKFEITRISLSISNALISSIALFLIDEPQPVRPLVFLSLALFAALCVSRRDNVLFLARTFILGALGYLPIIVKALFGPEALFSSYEPDTQGFDIAVLTYTTTSFAIFSSEIGILLGAKAVRTRVVRLPSTRQSSQIWEVAFWLSVPVVLAAAHIARAHGGASIFEAGYASESTELNFGSAIAFGIIALLAMYVGGMKNRSRRWLLLFLPIAVYFLVYSLLLTGQRQDVMTPVFGMLVCYGLVQGRAVSLRLRYLPILLVLYVFFETWGLARQVISSSQMGVFELVNLAFSNLNSTDALQLGTASPIATTFANTVWMIETGTIDKTWGYSYFEYFLRTPPKALYPDRPTDYAWMFEQHGLEAGGGFFELGEVYMNFGIMGALIVPGVISFLMARSFRYVLEKQSAFSYFLIFSFLGVFLRGTWYQTFAFYRAFLAAMSLYLLIIFVLTLTRKLQQAASAAKSRTDPLTSNG